MIQIFNPIHQFSIAEKHPKILHYNNHLFKLETKLIDLIKVKQKNYLLNLKNHLNNHLLLMY